MRTFKQFELGDTKYTLSFDRYTSVYPNSKHTAYLRISSRDYDVRDITLKVYKPRYVIIQWQLILGDYSVTVTGEHKSKEAKRLILNYLLNERR